jgi:hypothetical protein
MRDFFSFRLMISTGLIKILYPLGALALLIAPFACLFFLPKDFLPTVTTAVPWEIMLLSMIIGQVSWRVFCEQLILLFSIHESLKKSEGRAAGK